MLDIAQILHDNGFKYHKNPKNTYTLIVEDLEIVNFEPMIEYIDVRKEVFTIYINFKGYVPDETNFGLNFDVNGYWKYKNDDYIIHDFSNEDDFINELHRMNTIGPNIKG